MIIKDNIVIKKKKYCFSLLCLICYLEVSKGILLYFMNEYNKKINKLCYSF